MTVFAWAIAATPLLFLATLSRPIRAQQPAPAAEQAPAEQQSKTEGQPSDAPASPDEGGETSGSGPANPAPVQRANLNLLGQTDTRSGESRRNENVQFNLVDNNALKEMNIRLGATATIVEALQVDRGYFGAEYGSAPRAPVHAAAIIALCRGLLYPR